MQKLRRSLFTPGDRVLVAVSGGPDSLSLLHTLHREQESLGLTALEAAHMDHGLRGNESAAEAIWVRDWCTERGIPCHLGKADTATVAKSHQISTQQAARQVRYDFLDSTAAALGSHRIATAHNQDDQAETVLLNILRGTGLDGLRGIPERRGLYIRPLLSASRSEIEAYCLRYGLEPRRDPSNLLCDHYTRNRVRLELLPQLAREYNAAVSSALVRLSEIARRDADYLHLQAERALLDATLSSGIGKLTLDTAALNALHPALLRHVLRAAVSQIRENTQGITYHSIEKLSRHVSERADEKNDVSYQGLFPRPSCHVLLNSDTVIFTREDVPAMVPQTVWHLTTALVPQSGEYTARVDAEQVDRKTLYVRTWQNGDKIAPLGLGGHHKKLSDIFADAKVPRTQRGSVPIVGDKNGLVWVAGYTLSDLVKVTELTTQTLFLAVTCEDEIL
jgi:tRNA(Ile)-lysidine synthase